MRTPTVLAALALTACTSGAEARAWREGGERGIAMETAARLREDASSLVVRPLGISVDPNGHYVIPDRSDKNIKVFAPGGDLVRIVGRAGHGPGEFTGLAAGQAYGDSTIGYDIAGGRLTVFGPDGRYVRSLTLAGRYPLASSVSVVDDSLFLLTAFAAGNAGRNLLTLIRPDGSRIASFFNPSNYLSNTPALLQNTGVKADGVNGVVFAVLVGGDSVYAFDYAGHRLGSQGVDPEQPLVTTRTLLERNGGKLRRPDGTFFSHGNRNVIGLVALDSGTVALQVSAYDAVSGTDPVEGGTLLLHALGPDGSLAPIARRDVAGAVLGRDHQHDLLLVRYAADDPDAHEVVRVVQHAVPETAATGGQP